MIAIVDYGAGNIFSVKNALDYLEIEAVLTDNHDVIRAADKIILPGVGAFPFAMEQLSNKNLVEILKEQAKVKPFLGICLGMQILFEKGYEFGETEGLGLIAGSVELMERETLSIPHIGWNSLEMNSDSCEILAGLSNEDYVYFVHSYAAVCDEKNVAAFADYGGKIPACVTDNKYVYGCQFHPEKSGDCGLKILRNFCNL